MQNAPLGQPIFLFALITLPKEYGYIIVELLQNTLCIFKNDIINIAKLDKMELIRRSLPPDDNSLPFQLLSFFEISLQLASNPY
jgi:hypothetical protein